MVLQTKKDDDSDDDEKEKESIDISNVIVFCVNICSILAFQLLHQCLNGSESFKFDVLFSHCKCFEI